MWWATCGQVQCTPRSIQGVYHSPKIRNWWGIVCITFTTRSPSEHQLKAVGNRYLFTLDMDKAIERATKSCRTCASVLNIPHTIISQSTDDPSESVGIMFTADILKHEWQLIFIVHEYVMSMTMRKNSSIVSVTMFLEMQSLHCASKCVHWMAPMLSFTLIVPQDLKHCVIWSPLTEI